MNLIGTINVCRHLIKGMLRLKNGCIINIGSVVGIEGNIGQSIYSASKAGIIGWDLMM